MADTRAVKDLQLGELLEHGLRLCWAKHQLAWLYCVPWQAEPMLV
jgi:hypothetical protein